MNENATREENEADHSVSAQVLVPFCEIGDKLPVYFIPAGYGDVRMFGRVVDLIDDDRPAYGLQPPKLELFEGIRKKSIQWLISMYISEIKRVQPQGPYNLAGYSTGGLITIEIAQQLIRGGDAVDFLILLDPPLQNPWWINLPYLGLSKLFNLTPLTDKIRWILIRRWNSLFLRCVSDEGLCSHVAILREHAAVPYPGRIILFRPRRSWIRLVNWTRIGKSWLKFAQGGLEVHRIPGAHNEMLRGRQRTIVAAVLKGCLERIERAGPTPRFQHPTSCKVAYHKRTVYSASIEQDRIDEIFDWDAMERLHRKGLVADPAGIASSAGLVEAALREAAATQARLFDADG